MDSRSFTRYRYGGSWRGIILMILSLTGLAMLITACGQFRSTQRVIAPIVPDFNEYSAKFICGTIRQTTSPDLPLNVGRYFTTVNVHNPSTRETVTLWYKAVVSREQSSSPTGSAINDPSAFRRTELMTDYALEIDCREIRNLVNSPPDFIEGWVVIMTAEPLDVSPVYSAGSTATVYPVQSIDVEQIKPRKIRRPSNLIEEEIPTQARCPGGEGCCCNIFNRTAGQTWPACDTRFDCRSWVPGPTPPAGPIATCTPTGRSLTFHSQLHSSQPPFCGNP